MGASLKVSGPLASKLMSIVQGVLQRAVEWRAVAKLVIEALGA
jgi:hypothetical protein